MIKKILIFLLIPYMVFGNIKFKTLKESIKFTEYGREVTVTVQAVVELKPNYFYKEWAYLFDKRAKIQISEAKVIGRQYKTTFNNNELRFQFNNAFNGDRLEFYFKYLQFNDNDNVYSRQEYVSIPQFFNSANATLEVIIPDKLAVYSLNPKFKKFINTYTWTGQVSKNGFSDIFYLTLKQARWKVNILSKIFSDKKISKIDIVIPAYFKNGNNIIEKYDLKTNYDHLAKITDDNTDIKINFDKLKQKEINITLDAILKNDFDQKVWIKLDPNKYLNIDKQLAFDLQNIIHNNIKVNAQQKPLYMIIAEWVNNYIQYDDNYYAKDMTTREILKKGKGVCVHYATLYNDLLKAAGIPSIIVSGESYNTEKKAFEGHAWNLVYYNGEWISIDPTWGLYSGKLPVSHIFFYLGERPIIKFTSYYVNDPNEIKSDVIKKVNFINDY